MTNFNKKEFCKKIKEKFSNYFIGRKVLDINGENKDLFNECNYLGLGLDDDKNLIFTPYLFDGPDNYFDTIIYTDGLNHDLFYTETIKNIIRMLKPGGLFLFTCDNLKEKDFIEISEFNQVFPDCYFEHNKDSSYINFYGIKGGEKYMVDNITPNYKKEDFENHIFVIDSWPDNESKENDLINCIKTIKTFNIPILLVGHYPIKPEIQKMVDYYIFDKNNPLLSSDEFPNYGVDSTRWTHLHNKKIENVHRFHHDYAIWETMRNAFNFCNYLNKKYIHFLEYDNIPDIYQYRQSFLERIRDFDAILYQYDLDSNKNNLDIYCSTYIFSVKTDIALKVIDEIKNKTEFFSNKPSGWQLERQFLRGLRKVTNNIHVSKYIPNNNELNTQSVWNRDGMVRNGTYFQPYICADEDRNLYLHLIHGFYYKKSDENYLIEVDYDNFKKFIKLNKDEMHLEFIGKYKKGKRVKLYIKGVEVFNEFLGEDFETFYKHDHVKSDTPKKLNVESKRKININFIEGPYVNILDESDPECKLKYNVEFINSKTNTSIYNVDVVTNCWAKAATLYYVEWKIKVRGINNDYYDEFLFNPNGKKFLISFESSSLGDNLAWIPYVEEFRLKNKCNVVCSTFFNSLFKEDYPSVEFVEPGTTVDGIHGMYRVGIFSNSENKIDFVRHPNNPIKEPLMKVASDILGLEYKELKPRVKTPQVNKKKRVSIAIHSTSQCKYWNNPTGWQEVVDFLTLKGYEVRLLSREEDGYMGNKDPKGVVHQPPSNINEIIKILKESELFIGISSGLSWLAWSINVPTILISGFTDIYLEPLKDLERVINKNVCHGCWHKHDFDRGDWNWCPEHKGTDRQFECTKEIKGRDIIKLIEKYI